MGLAGAAALALLAVLIVPGLRVQTEQPEAIRSLKEALRLDPNFPRVHERLAMSYWLDGSHRGGRGGGETGASPAGRVLRASREGACRLLQSGVAATMPEHEWPGGLRASYHALAGDRDGALDALDRAFRERHPLLPNVLAFPPLDPLRSEQRLTEILRPMNLKP